MNQTLQQTVTFTHTSRRQQNKAGVLAKINTWLQRNRSRRELAELPAYLLKDIGLHESDRYREISKPFWQR
ncbi:DUF1127 domain-containing protein [Zobellella maritima]|uniref:DUF1127 domain-containing protein n=1 Tax=Zobellella maritima TaxID=2059725 RepID=UPI000E30976F|nr:DUF1127 domain-containing protein [Zobellella maritima]